MTAIDPDPADGHGNLLTRRHRVVIVDDEGPVLAALRRVLRNEPYEVLPPPVPTRRSSGSKAAT